MLNTVMLVGRLTQDPEIRVTESNKEVVRICVAVNRSFKNPDGIYETDFIDCTLWEGLAKNLSEYCHKGDTIGIRGRIQTNYYEKDEQKIKRLEIIAERVTFLSSSKNKVNDNSLDNKKKTESSKSLKEKQTIYGSII